MSGLAGKAALAAATVGCVLLSACLEPDRPHLAFRDTTPPTLIETDPAEGGLLDLEGALLLTFSEKMDPRSLVPGLWLLQGTQRLAVQVEIPPEDGLPDAVEQTDAPYGVRMRWLEPLQPATDYTVVLDSVLIDTEGNPLAGPDGGTSQRLSFRTP